MWSLFRYRELVRNLVLKDLKLKYRDSVLGFLWSLASPLLLILVYSFVFGHILRGGPANFAYFLTVGILPWNFFAQSLMMSTGSILDNGSLIRKVALPMEVFPVTTVLFNLAQFLFALMVFFPMAWLFFEVPLAWSWVSFLPILVLHVVFTVGLCFIVSTATVFYRDVRHFTEIFLMLIFWLTPIIYDVQSAPPALKKVLYMNPFSYFVLAYQDALYRNVFSSASHWLAITSLAVGSLALGYTLFTSCKTRFPEEA
jgi:lipopolysaccharide transport system permease protein